MQRTRCLAVAAGLLLAPGPGLGIAAQETMDQGPFESRVSRVRIDVLVHDDHGRFVTDLTADDFRVYEDGSPQEILGVTLVVPEEEIPVRTAAATTGPAATIRDVVPTADLGTVVYLLDARVLDTLARKRFLEGWRAVLSETSTLRFPTAVYAIDAEGRLRPLAPLTTDAARLREAAEELRDWAYFESGGRTGPEPPPQTVDAGRSQRRQVGGIELDALIPDYQELDRGLHTYEVIRVLSEGLATRPGRKALVWVSTGLDWAREGMATFGGRSGAFNPAIDRAFERDPRVDHARRFAERAANTANVSVYGLDPSLGAARRPQNLQGDEGWVDALLRDPLESTLDEASRSRDVLRLTAAATGGESYLYHGLSVADSIREINEQSARFYLLTYATPAPEGDGRFHDIRVEVGRPGLRVRHRPGYVDLPGSPDGADRLAPVDAVPGLSMDVPLDLLATERLGPDGARRVGLGIAFRPGAPGRAWTIEAQAVRGGRVREARRQQLGEADVRSLTGETGRLVTGFDWPLEPGAYDLRVAVYDEGIESISVERLRVSVAEPCGEWCTAAPWVVTVDGAAPAPAFGNVVVAGSRSAVVVDVFRADRPVLGGSVFTADGRRRLAQLQAVVLDRRPDGIHTGTLALPAGLPSGEYLIDVRVTDPEAGHSQASRIPLSVIAPGTRRP